MQGRCAGSASGAWRASVAFAACWVIVLPAIVPADAAARARHRPKVRHVCTRATVPSIGKHGKHRKPRRIRYCVTIRPINHAKLRVQTRSGGFTPPPLGFSVPDQGETAPLPVGPFRPLGHPVVKRRVLGVVVPTAGNALPPTLPIDVGFAATHLITPDETPARKHDTLVAQEPSVASAGRVVMYTFNWDAAYSVDGGKSWTELDPHTVLPTPAVGGFGCDQVVQYDPSTKVFIWVLQYECRLGVNLIRVAWASASRLERLGPAAWSHVDIDPAMIAGKGNTFLDQPRLGFTPTFLYMSLNQGALTLDSHGKPTGADLKHAAVVRIPRAAFSHVGGGLPLGFALLDPVSLRVAQNVRDTREFFVGHNGTSKLRIAWIDDSSNEFDLQDISSPTIATQDWTSTTPGGQDMLLHQSTSQGTAVTGVTQGGDGNVWAAWTEARKLPNGTAKYGQPHVGVAVLQPIPGHSGFFLQVQNEYAASFGNYSLPDLATDASGEVAFDVVWGGGGRFFANHAVGFLRPRDHRSNAFAPIADALSNTDNAEITGLPGDPVGDYETVRPMPPPYGDCLVAAGIVNRLDSAGNAVGYPVFSIFSRPSVKCPPSFKKLPVLGFPGNAPPIERQATVLGLTCPTSVAAGSAIDLSGRLAPHQSGRPITITVTGPGSGSVSTRTGLDGSYAGTYRPTQPGQYTFTASYAGDAAVAAARSPACMVTVAQPVAVPTTVSLVCPANSVSGGDPINLSGSLSPPLPSRTITITDSGADSASFSATTAGNGTYTSTTYTPAHIGTHTFTARYAGEPGYLPSTSTSCSVEVVGIIP